MLRTVFLSDESQSQVSQRKLKKDNQKLDHFNILTVKNNTILDSEEFKCLEKIPERKYHFIFCESHQIAKKQQFARQHLEELAVMHSHMEDNSDFATVLSSLMNRL